MTHETTKTDGRKMRWFDCDWNNNTGVPNGCTMCKVCKYLNFIEWAESVAPPESTIERDAEIEKYLAEKYPKQ